ncbi:helix-turn-helix domain-containing protein [Aquabacterium sp. J223]|uniref:helix-turn-helix domain-containing protein n=1 Tax=Aquabacterium sp. J223 TaxID=2898431 RepID=UPI0021ADC375|nr:helix-turn-helix domain-containing protein [Aquabacterium sp. J223]UUX97372.1 helix-turn-helix domain-containing protein [Aquabacterium sp. J223]
MNIDSGTRPPCGLVALGEDRAPMALTRVLHLLRLLAERPGGLSLAPLSAALDAPKTSVLSLLRGLTARGYLQRSDGVYRLGPESLSLGALLVSARQPAAPARRAPRAPQSSASACFDAMRQQVLQGGPRRAARRNSDMDATSQ